jgi:hypothetical protein
MREEIQSRTILLEKAVVIEMSLVESCGGWGTGTVQEPRKGRYVVESLEAVARRLVKTLQAEKN